MREQLAEELHRTIKLEVDDGARSLEEAETIAQSHVLQVVVGEDVAGSATFEALLVTLLNVAPRAFIGGVRIAASDDITLSARWTAEQSLSKTADRYGCESASSAITDEYPTIVVGEVRSIPPGSTVLLPTWNGWSGGIVRRDEARLRETQEFPTSGVLAAALAVSEAFQHVRGDVMAGHREIGLSLWDLLADWQSAEAIGPERYYLPEALWLLGLGHLGQSYAWNLGLLPYPDPGDLTVTLQDVDRLTAANAATAVLAQAADLPQDGSAGERKTRLVGRRLEAIGIQTVLVERLFDEGARRHSGEPIAALGGFDDPEPRRGLEEAGFARIVDAGLGGGVRSYLEMAIHSFPSQFQAAEVFADRDGHPERRNDEAYKVLLEELVAAGMSPDEAQCGIVDQVAGRSIASAFVGAAAGAIVISEVLRDLFGRPRSAFLDLSLRDLGGRQVVLAPEVEPVGYGSIVSA